MARHVDVDPVLWEEFHRVVNMSSRELSVWLRTRSAGEGSEALPDRAGTETGRRVLRILQKRRVDLDEEDEHTTIRSDQGSDSKFLGESRPAFGRQGHSGQ